MASVIRIICLAHGCDEIAPPQWLASYDVDARDGRGEVRTTRDKGAAQRFQGAVEAMEAWRTQSRARPLRPDGKPNRPLTAYTVEIEQL